jgi:hypothetical protein
MLNETFEVFEYTAVCTPKPFDSCTRYQVWVRCTGRQTWTYWLQFPMEIDAKQYVADVKRRCANHDREIGREYKLLRLDRSVSYTEIPL